MDPFVKVFTTPFLATHIEPQNSLWCALRYCFKLQNEHPLTPHLPLCNAPAREMRFNEIIIETHFHAPNLQQCTEKHIKWKKYKAIHMIYTLKVFNNTGVAVAGSWRRFLLLVVVVPFWVVWWWCRCCPYSEKEDAKKRLKGGEEKKKINVPWNARISRVANMLRKKTFKINLTLRSH